MRRVVSLAVLIILMGSVHSSAQDQNVADPLNLGVQAYKNAHYEEAIEWFKKAIAADPSRLNARLYLGTAYAQQVIPGSDSPENKQIAQNAISEFSKVLDLNPSQEQRVSALKGIAALYFNVNDLDQAKGYNQKVIEADPSDPETYYTIGVIDWAQSYKPRMEARARLGLEPNEPMNDTALCLQIRAANEDKVKEGIDMLAKALELRPDYDDAMAYMNLMYRERADIQCGDTAAREADLKKADEWIDLTLATKKRKSERPGVTGTPPPPPSPPK